MDMKVDPEKTIAFLNGILELEKDLNNYSYATIREIEAGVLFEIYVTWETLRKVQKKILEVSKEESTLDDDCACSHRGNKMVQK